jgi:AraC-like DNA-binding protein
MTTSGQDLSQTSHPRLRPFENAPRALVGYTHDYPAGWHTGQHAHPRAQLIYATAGVMRIDTADIAYVVPPTTALVMPANTSHSVRMDGPVAMRALFLREDAAAQTANRIAVIAVSALLREVILAACAEPLDWDLQGRGQHLTALALDEITRATPLPLGLPMPRDPRLQRVAVALRARPDDARGLDDFAAIAGASTRTLARLFRTETGISFRQWRQQARMTEALAALDSGATPARAAALAGYASQPAFGAAFRAVFGMTPGQARRIA